MEKKKAILQKLDAAIDSMDMEQIQKQLELLETIQPTATASQQEAEAFASRVLALDAEKNQNSQRKQGVTMKKTLRRLLAVAAVAVMLTAVAYASGIWKTFSFAGDGTLTTVNVADRTLTPEEAKALAEYKAQGTKMDIETTRYDTAGAAVEAFGAAVPLPAPLPELPLADASLERCIAYDQLSLVYQEDAKYLGVTATRKLYASMASTVDMDEGSLGSYKNAHGQQFQTFSDSNPENPDQVAYIANAEQGGYSYALVLIGYTQQEQQAFLDSIDLSVYGG